MFYRIITALLTFLALSAGPSLAETRTITGTVTYLERIALPKGAELQVSLVPAGGGAGAVPVASARGPMTKVPMPFELRYQADQITQGSFYLVEARIYLEDDLLFISTDQGVVLTEGAAADPLDIIVRRGSERGPPEGRLNGTNWTVTEIAGAPVSLDRMPTLGFGSDLDLAVFGGCNQFAGRVEVDADDAFALSGQMAGTLKACSPTIEHVERGMLDALGRASRYMSDATTLVLSDGQGTVLIRARRDR